MSCSVFRILSLQVLVHGEATVMARLKAALLREYEDNQVFTHMGWGEIIYVPRISYMKLGISNNMMTPSRT